MSLNPTLKNHWQTKADVKILKGGRSSSKTWDAAGISIALAQMCTLKFLCMRQFQNRIQESVYAILVIQIKRFNLEDEFEILKTVIRHKITGSEFHFYGIHRNIAEIKGFEGADIGWIEEGEGLTKEQWEIIEPTFRKEGSEIWILYNPRFQTDFIETFKHDPENGTIVSHINYDQNPFLSNKMARTIQKMKEQDYDNYLHIYKGVPKNDDDEVIIKRIWIEASIDAAKKLGIKIEGTNTIGFDIADDGVDKCATVSRHGIECTNIKEWKAKEDELLESSQKAYYQAIEENCNYIVYDGIGVGAGAGSHFKSFNKEQNKSIKYASFEAGGGVEDPENFINDANQTKNKDFYENIKAQKWWDIAERFKETYNAVVKGYDYDPDNIISISSKCDKIKDLIAELSIPHQDRMKSGKVKVESKDDLKKRKVPSTNIADAFIMAYGNIKPRGNSQVYLPNSTNSK